MSAGETGNLTSITVNGIRGYGPSYVVCVQAKIYSDSTKSLLLETSINSVCDTDSSGSGFSGIPASGALNFSNTTFLQSGSGYFFELSATSGDTIFYTYQSYSSPQGNYLGGQLFVDGSFKPEFDMSFVLTYSIPDSTPPTFPSAETFNTPENTTSVGTITTSESSTVTIFGGEDQAKFSIARLTDSSTALSFVSAPNFEAPTDVGANNSYVVVFRAVDGATNAGYETVTVTVTNVNEAPSITINSSAATHSITQVENISSVLTYTGDVDSGTTLTWSLTGTDAADLSIGSASGVLSFASSPDFEAPADADTNNTYIFIVTLSDGSLTDTQTVTITITNANETASLGIPSLSATPVKGTLLTITVTSTVEGKVRFFVDGKRITGCLARPTTGSYPNFTATCSWKPTVMNRQTVTARITPADNTFSASNSEALSLLVTKRVGTR